MFKVKDFLTSLVGNVDSLKVSYKGEDDHSVDLSYSKDNKFSIDYNMFGHQIKTDIQMIDTHNLRIMKELESIVNHYIDNEPVYTDENVKEMSKDIIWNITSMNNIDNHQAEIIIKKINEATSESKHLVLDDRISSMDPDMIEKVQQQLKFEGE